MNRKNVYRVELTLFGTAYIKAESALEAQAIAKLRDEIDWMADHSDCPFDSPQLPEFSVSSYMAIESVHAPELVEGEEEEEEEEAAPSSVRAYDIRSISVLHMGSYDSPAHALKALKEGTACVNEVSGDFGVSSAQDIIEGMRAGASAFAGADECGIFLQMDCGRWLHYGDIEIES